MIQKWTVKQDEQGNGWNVFSPNGGRVMGYYDWKYAIKVAHDRAVEDADKGLITVQLPEGAGQIGEYWIAFYDEDADEPVYKFFRKGQYQAIAHRAAFLPLAMKLICHHLAGDSDE